MSEPKEMNATEFHKWEREQDALPIDGSGKLCSYDLKLAGWIGRDGSFVRDGDHLMRRPLTWLPAPTDPLQEWKRQMDYAKADLERTLSDFNDLKSLALGEDGTSSRRFKWRPSYGADTGHDYETGLLQLVEAIRLKRLAFERLDSDPPLVVAQQREVEAKRKAQEAEWKENARRTREDRINRIRSISP